ncbi:M48 family metallopeptidase [Massilia sp. 9096]|uniref:M48 family metallopeptidase n=1 Tax=Massilia sp. 9096 TaxID=1500894 RepID=UPI0005613F72|nr:M48 family metallopeptidase [Massilia sp. 9096]
MTDTTITPMHDPLTAHYFDGHSARLHPASLSVHGALLRIATAGAERSVALETVRLGEPFANAPLVLRLQDGASCEVAPGPQRQALLDALGYRKSRVVRWQERWPAALAALVLLIALLALLYFKGIPAATERVAAALPPAVEVKLGQAALAGLEARGLIQASRLSEQRIAEVQALLPQALPAHPRMPIRLLVRNAPQLGANAFALPNGAIVLTDAMVRLVQTRDNQLLARGKDELLAVIGHEVGHIEHRHTSRVMASSSLSAALSAALFGDFSAVAAGLPAVLSQMQYSRAMELDADDYAVAVLRRNGIGPAPLGWALSALEHQDPGAASAPRWLKNTMGYLSTHPATRERIARLRAAAGSGDEDEGEDED